MNTTSKYSIADLENLSGVKAHTIRVWEKRYRALQPMRSPGNTRYYDDEQLIKLLHAVTLLEAGYKVSKIFTFSNQKIKELSFQISSQDISDKSEQIITQLLAYGFVYDEKGFYAYLDRVFAKQGTIDTYQKVVYPMLHKIGLLWGSEGLCPSKEHFISNLVRQKLIIEIAQMPIPPTTQNHWLLLLPDDEQHEIGLLLTNYFLRAHQQKTTYLGADVPVYAMLTALQQLDIQNVLLFIGHSYPAKKIQQYIDVLLSHQTQKNIFIVGNPKWTKQISGKDKVYFLHSFCDLEKIRLTP